MSALLTTIAILIGAICAAIVLPCLAVVLLFLLLDAMSCGHPGAGQ